LHALLYSTFEEENLIKFPKTASRKKEDFSKYFPVFTIAVLEPNLWYFFFRQIKKKARPKGKQSFLDTRSPNYLRAISLLNTAQDEKDPLKI
jgi:hypothetical protein